MATATAIISLLGLIGWLAKWYLTRKNTPTLDERIDDVEKDHFANVERIHRLRANGRHQEADELLRRLFQKKTLLTPRPPSVAAGVVSDNEPPPAQHSRPAPGKLVDGGTPEERIHSDPP